MTEQAKERWSLQAMRVPTSSLLSNSQNADEQAPTVRGHKVSEEAQRHRRALHAPPLLLARSTAMALALSALVDSRPVILPVTRSRRQLIPACAA